MMASVADVLLTHSNHLFHDKKQTEKMQPYPPLQTILAASVLRRAGINVALCDVTFESPEESFLKALAVYQPKLVVVCEDSFNFLSKMCLTRNRELACEMARVARSRGIRIAAHGPDASDRAGEYLSAGFNYVLLGEVEPTLLELASDAPLHEIAGLAYVSETNGPVQYTARRPLQPNLNALPQPAWDLIDIDSYRHSWNSRHGYFSLNVVSSRGCPFRCNWCAKPAFGNSYRVRGPEAIAEELLYLKTAYRPDHIWFADDIFAISNTWTVEFANAVDHLQAQIPFKMQSRCDLMTRSTVTALKRAGCAEVWMGAESGSQRILDAMDKGLRVEQIFQARANLARHGIRACFFLQFGYPGEGWQEIEATIQMVRETKPDDIGVSVSYPLPGTKFFDLVSSQLSRKANWSESGDLSMMFQGAFSSQFYRALADALHLEVRGATNASLLRSAWSRVHALRNETSTKVAEECA